MKLKVRPKSRLVSSPIEPSFTSARRRLAPMIADEADELGKLRLVGDMMRDNPERALALLAALDEGFNEGLT